VVAMTRDQMEQLRFRGRGAVVWLGTPPAPTHTHIHKCKLTAGRPGQQQQEQN